MHLHFIFFFLVQISDLALMRMSFFPLFLVAIRPVSISPMAQINGMNPSSSRPLMKVIVARNYIWKERDCSLDTMRGKQ